MSESFNQGCWFLLRSSFCVKNVEDVMHKIGVYFKYDSDVKSWGYFLHLVDDAGVFDGCDRYDVWLDGDGFVCIRLSDYVKNMNDIPDDLAGGLNRKFNKDKVYDE